MTKRKRTILIGAGILAAVLILIHFLFPARGLGPKPSHASLLESAGITRYSWHSSGTMLDGVRFFRFKPNDEQLSKLCGRYRLKSKSHFDVDEQTSRHRLKTFLRGAPVTCRMKWHKGLQYYTGIKEMIRDPKSNVCILRIKS